MAIGKIKDYTQLPEPSSGTLPSRPIGQSFTKPPAKKPLFSMKPDIGQSAPAGQLAPSEKKPVEKKESFGKRAGKKFGAFARGFSRGYSY